jgi:hypothetical protein
MKRLAAILLLLATTIALSAGAHSKNKPRPRDGDYNVSIAGYFKGEGSGTVSGDRINLQLSVVAETGAKGTLVVPAIPLTGNHFSGAGSFLGQPVTFNGRVDAPDDLLEKGIKGVRLVALVKTTNGRYSRLVGYIPALAAANNPQDDRGRGK